MEIINKGISILAKEGISTQYRIYGLLNKKGYNINAASSYKCKENSGCMRIDLDLDVNQEILVQAKNYFDKMVDIIKIDFL